MQDLSAAWLYPIILVAGALQAWGPPMNGALRNSLTNPWLALADWRSERRGRRRRCHVGRADVEKADVEIRALALTEKGIRSVDEPWT
jgi:hypothetical protein